MTTQSSCLNSMRRGRIISNNNRPERPCFGAGRSRHCYRCLRKWTESDSLAGCVLWGPSQMETNEPLWFYRKFFNRLLKLEVMTIIPNILKLHQVGFSTNIYMTCEVDNAGGESESTICCRHFQLRSSSACLLQVLRLPLLQHS